MYHLTCPSCQDVADSPFVRSGAVVRCAACGHKYRIKSAHFTRELHTGPRTLDETDTVLRSDSVDIDPDEVSPVSIDEEGNVVGLSGLSELMRWSDNQDQSQVTGTPSPTRSKGKGKGKSKNKTETPVSDDLPEARPAKNTKPTKSKRTAHAEPNTRSTGTARNRGAAQKRKKNNQLMIVLGTVGVVVIGLAIAIPLAMSNGGETTTSESDNEKPVDIAGDTGQDRPEPDPDRATPDPVVPDEVRVFTDDYTPSPNPQATFVPPWIQLDNSQPPADVPTVLTPAKPLTHEGWYVTNPPRGAAEASGLINVEFGQITATNKGDDTLLVGDVSNKTNEVVMRGELHIMLLDSTGNVFAETFVPLAMIPPRSEQQVAMMIPTRYWARQRGVRAGVRVTEWSDSLAPNDNLELAHTDLGPSSSVRLSLKHASDRPLRGITMLLTAKDSEGSTLGNFLIEENNLYIENEQWLDLVIGTPLPKGQSAEQWSWILQTK
ncbi:MAG: hypothetical protein AAF085_06420 [Planctomycetota bacterium]